MQQKITVNYSTDFSRLLCSYVESSGYTVYKISQITGLGRTAIHQTMSGKLVPTREFFERLCSAFMITPQQKAELTELYLKVKIGEKAYFEQQRIKAIVEKLPQYYIKAGNVTIQYDTALYEMERSVTGILNVNHAVMQIIGKELQREKPFISTTIPFENKMLYDLVLQLISGTGKNAVFEHYLRMFKSDDNGVDNNIDLLENMLRMAMNTGMVYRPFCYYVHKDAVDDILPIYPYCLITSEYVIMITEDFQSAVISDSKSVIETALEHIRKVRTCSKQIIEPVDNRKMFDIFAESSKMFSKSIEFQPCVTKFFTWDIVSTRLADIPEKEYILETLRKSFFTPEQLAEAEAQVSMNYFTRKGLEYFADTGVTVNLPGQLLKPLSESERLYILTSLKNDVGKHFKMLNEDKIKVPEFIQVISLTNQSCIISCLMKEKKFCCILSERSLCSAIDGFVERLDETDYTMTDEKAVEAIDRCIFKLTNNSRGKTYEV